MRSYILFFILFFAFGCSQSQSTSVTVNQNPEITSKNIAETIKKQIKHYDYEPRYFIKISQNWCFAEILINDIPVYNNYIDETVGLSISINHTIFKSGAQKITYRLYPIEKKFDDNTSIEIKVREYNNKNDDAGKDVISYESNNDEIQSKKSYYENSFTFNAVVPYTLDGFDNTSNLKNLNENELKSKLIKKYESLSKLYENKDYDEIARISYNQMRNQFIAEYNDSDIDDSWTELLNVYKKTTLKMEPIKDYKMVFYGNGHLVALIQNSDDKRLKGKGLIWGKYLDEGKTKATFNNSLMYIPNNKTEFEVY